MVLDTNSRMEFFRPNISSVGQVRKQFFVKFNETLHQNNSDLSSRVSRFSRFFVFLSSGDVATSDILIPFKVNECKVLKPSSTHKTGLIYDRIRINCDFLWCARGKVIFVVDFIKYVAPLKSQILSQVENIFRHKIKSSIGPVIGSLSWEHRSQQKAEREDSNRQR